MHTLRGLTGYPRTNRPTGIRNAVLVISGDLCCNPWSQKIAAAHENLFAITHKHGVGNFAPDRALFKRLMGGIVSHPNTAGFVYVSSGNEDHAPEEILEAADKADVPFLIVSARDQASGKTLIEIGIAQAEKLLKQADSIERQPAKISDLVIGLNCAGTDTVSADSVHPVLGRAVDMLVAESATVILSETPDLIGLEDLLFDRCERPEDRERLIAMYEAQKARLSASGESIDDIEMVAFNTEGGLESLRHKAAVSVMKAGTQPIREVVEYGVKPSRKGLILMDGPAMTDFVMAGLMGAGAQLMINTCGAGAGNKMPFTVGADTPSPILPVLKMSGSEEYTADSGNCIDFCAAPSGESLDSRAEELLRLIQETASGQKTQTEWGLDYMMHFQARHYQA